MPNFGTPWIRNNLLKCPDQPPIRLDTPAWFAWLETISLFCYQPPDWPVRVTLRKEKRRQQFYWYAYLKKQGKLHNMYIGKTETLTAARLQQVAETLRSKARQSR